MKNPGSSLVHGVVIPNQLLCDARKPGPRFVKPGSASPSIQEERAMKSGISFINPGPFINIHNKKCLVTFFKENRESGARRLVS